MNEGQPCIVCGHSVVGWDPDESMGPDDYVCYSCGTHEESEVAEKVKDLRTQIKALLKSNKNLHAANVELAAALDAREKELKAKHKALEDWREAAFRTRSMLEETQQDCLKTMRDLADNPLVQRQAE